MNEELKIIKKKQIKRILLTLIFIIFIVSIVFLSFKISTDAHRVFREAKNIKLSLRMLDIEYYGQGSTIYNPKQRNGLSNGVMERIVDLLEHDAEVTLTGYDSQNRIVTDFVYSYGHYQVVYTINENNKDDYRVNYIFPIYHYNGTE